MKTETSNKQDEEQNGGAARDCPDSAGSVEWVGSTGEIDSEVWSLVDLVENGWAWQWPGWSWIADSLNHWHKNNRTANACRKKYDRIISQNTK